MLDTATPLDRNPDAAVNVTALSSAPVSVFAPTSPAPYPILLFLSLILRQGNRKPQMDKIPIECRFITTRLKAQNKAVFLQAE